MWIKLSAFFHFLTGTGKKICPRKLVNSNALCYNESMDRKKPDFEQCKRVIEEKKQQFELFYSLLKEYNNRYNLTAILEEDEVYHKHFLDSLAGADWFRKGARVAEVGSGAGFPSVPLMIARDDLQFTLIESTGKKCDFLKIVVSELRLHATVLTARAEEAARDGAYREQFDVCCARAVARMNTLAEYCMPFVKVGGTMIAYKGNAEEEVEEASRALRLLGGGETERICYELPEQYGERMLVCVKKAAHTPEKYPRGQGKERSKPL